MALSKRPEARARQLANLRPPTPAPPGNQHTRTHGGYARIAVERLDAKSRDVFDALAADAPLRGPDGGLPAADAVSVRLLSDVLCRLDDVGRWLDDFGKRDERTGDTRRSILELESRLRREALDYAEALGMTPRSRARLGLDLQRGVDYAAAMADDYRREREESGGDA